MAQCYLPPYHSTWFSPNNNNNNNNNNFEIPNNEEKLTNSYVLEN
jgi:hypothetical protein